MAYRIENHENLSSALARVIVEQCEVACDQLDRRGPDRHAGVHDARRAIRRARAAQALLQPAFAREDWVRISADLRMAGRVLSPLRDAQSVIEAIEEHLQDAVGALGGTARTRLLAALRRRRDRIGAAGTAAISEARAALARAAASAVVDTAGWDADALAAGLAAGRARLARAVRRARKRVDDDDALHRVRQRARTHWLQIELLVAAWPGPLAALAGEAKKLSKMLGDERDLQMLDGWLARRRTQATATRSVMQMRAVIAGLRQDLRSRGLHQAALVCLSPARRFGHDVVGLRMLAVEAAAALGPEDARRKPAAAAPIAGGPSGRRVPRRHK
jgi:CHAD domain-containing protein